MAEEQFQPFLPNILNDTENDPVIEDDFMEIDLGEETMEDIIETDVVDHFANLVPYLDEDYLTNLGQEVLRDVEADEASRKTWMSTVEDGLEELGLETIELSEPFEGACGATHPLILESAVKFQARAYKSLYPPAGPVRTVKKLGKDAKLDPEIEDRMLVFQRAYNEYLTETAPEFYEEGRRMLLYLPVVGSAFKKVYFDSRLSRTTSTFIPVDNFIISENESTLETADRYSHRFYRTESQFASDVAGGFYEDLTHAEAGEPKRGTLSVRISEDTGMGTPSVEDNVYTLIEHHTYLDIPGIFGEEDGVPLPYIVTIEESTGQVIALRRNWQEDDIYRRKVQHFAHYSFVPGFGFLGLGYIHLLGNLQMTLTAIMRSLVDSGQFANLQGGFKTKNIRVQGSNSPHKPGEFKEADVLTGSIKDAIYPLPFKEPSGTLFNLMGFIQDNGQKFADNTEKVLADSANYGKVGTTMTMLEESTQFFTSTYQSLHKAMKKELTLMARLNTVYSDILGEELSLDFDMDGMMDIVPVSDPNYPTRAHQLSLAQTRLNLALQAPEIHNMRAAYEDFYRVLEMDSETINNILPSPKDPEPRDPLSDIQAAIDGKPIKAFPEQDHQAHITVKQQFLQDPDLGGSQMMAPARGILAANIREHMFLQYSAQMQAVAGQALQQGAQPSFAMQQAAQRVAKLNDVARQQMSDQDPASLLAAAEYLKAQTDQSELEHDKKKEMIELALKLEELELKKQKELNRMREKGLQIATDSAKQDKEIGAEFLKEALKSQ